MTSQPPKLILLDCCCIRPVAPAAAYEVILERGIIGQFREFDSPRVNSHSYKFVGTFSWAQINLGKAREREQHSMKNRRAVGLLIPTRDNN